MFKVNNRNGMQSHVHVPIHAIFKCAIVIRFILDNWPFERAIIACVPVAKRMTTRAKISVFLWLIQNYDFHVFPIVIFV